MAIISNAEIRSRAEEILHSVYGEDSHFREGQYEAIEAVSNDPQKNAGGSAHRLGQKPCLFYLHQPGNMELIKMGAIPIDDSWDGKIENLPLSSAAESSECEQLTFYG